MLASNVIIRFDAAARYHNNVALSSRLSYEGRREMRFGAETRQKRDAFMLSANFYSHFTFGLRVLLAKPRRDKLSRLEILPSPRGFRAHGVNAKLKLCLSKLTAISHSKISARLSYRNRSLSARVTARIRRGDTKAPSRTILWASAPAIMTRRFYEEATMDEAQPDVYSIIAAKKASRRHGLHHHDTFSENASTMPSLK